MSNALPRTDVDAVAALRTAGRYASALRQVDEILAAGRSDRAVEAERIRLFLEIGRHADAYAAHAEIGEVSDDIDSVVLRGELRLANGLTEIAHADARTAIAMDDKHRGGWTLLAAVLESTGDRSGAQEALRTALTLDPPDPSSFQLLHLLDDDAVPTARELADRHGDDARALACIGWGLTETDAGDDIRRIASRALSLDPQRFDVRVLTCMAAVLDEDFEGTLQLTNQMLTELDSPIVVFLRAVGLMGEQRLAEAVADLDAAFSQMPGSLAVLAVRAAAHLHGENWTGAVADANSVLDRRPTAGATRMVRATAHTHLGDDRAALRDVERCLADNGSDAEALALRGSIAVRNGDPSSGLRDIDAALADAITAERLLVRGFALHGLGRDQDANEAFAAALRLEPRNAVARHWVTTRGGPWWKRPGTRKAALKAAGATASAVALVLNALGSG